MLERDFGIFSSYSCDYLAPQGGSCEHVGFVDASQAALTRSSSLESITRHSFDFRRTVLRHVARARVAVVAMKFVRAEVNVARKFAHDFEIASGDAVGPKRRNSLQRVAQTDRAKIDVETEFFSQGEQAAFWAIREWKRVPLWPADGAEQNRIGFAAFSECRRGQRSAERIDCSAAEWKFAKVEAVAMRCGAILKDVNCRASDFWTDAVTGQHCDRFANGTHGRFSVFQRASIFSLPQRRRVALEPLDLSVKPFVRDELDE
jgi:hypothetical protein